MKKIAVVGFNEKNKLNDFLNKLKSLENKYKISFTEFIYSKKDFNLYDKLNGNYNIKDFDAAISIGGDGTFLYTSRVFAGSNIPIFGVNLSSFGFNTKIEINKIEYYLEKFINNRCQFEYRNILDININNSKEIYNVVNDGVISHTGISRMIKLKVSLKEHIIYNFTGDGIIVSTSTGSTAYNLSAGGPILHPNVDAIVISPICPHTLAIRPFIVPIDEEINIEILESSTESQITLDGQKTINLKTGDIVTFKNSKKKIKLVKSEKNFSDILNEKLGWKI